MPFVAYKHPPDHRERRVKRQASRQAKLMGAILILVLIGWIAFGSGNNRDRGSSATAGKALATASEVPALLVGHYAQLSKEAVGCPHRRNLDQLANDAAAHDRVGFYRHMRDAGCIDIMPGIIARVLDSSGILVLYARIRLTTTENAYWINANPGTLSRWEPVKIGQEVFTTINAFGGLAACPRGLSQAPSGQGRAWMKANCVDVPKGTGLRVTGIRPEGGSGAMPLIGFTYDGKHLWLEWSWLKPIPH